MIAMVGAFTAAQAYETKFGDVSITFDTTVSMGASMLTQERETAFLPEANGGPVDPRQNGTVTGNVTTLSVGSLAALYGANPNPLLCAPACLTPVGGNIYTNNGFNYDGSANADDGRLNFDKGDLIGANVKASHDLIVSWQNYKVFARAVGFYDVIMNDKNAGDHSELTDAALGDVGRNYDLLDLFVSADYTLGGDIGVNLRAGKQVINWGESTFIQNGLNAFNPIDVAAIRKPGSEIKEALVPVNSIFASVSLPINISLSGWYALDWEPFEIDPSGTPFSTADIVALGSGVGGNQQYSFVTASPYGGNRRNCSASATSGTRYVQTIGLLNNPLAGTAALGNNLLECSDSAFVNMNVGIAPGDFERVRIGQAVGTSIGQTAGIIGGGTGVIRDLRGDGVTPGTTALLFGGNVRQAQDDGQYGIKASLFAEELNGTEFGFYFQNYHSRLPFVEIGGRAGATSGELSFFLNGANTEVGGVSGRQLNNVGCNIAAAAQIGTLNAPVVGAAGTTANATIGGLVATVLGTTMSAAAITQLRNTPVSDPGNVLQNGITQMIALSGGTMVPFDSDPGVGVNYRNQYNVALLNCALTYYQSGFVNPGTGTTVQSFDGAEFLLANGPGQVSVVYPEDIEVFGFSFNTTIGSWGLQGEATYRPAAPFQVDTDSLTIASLVEGCTFEMLYGAAGPFVDLLATPGGDGVKPACGGAVNTPSAVIRNEMFTAQIGTTSQFTGSDWFIDALGADIGTLVTEVGIVYVPGTEQTWIANGGANRAQYQNTGCQGTDLPGAGILSLDIKPSAQCRPTDFSAGLVALFTIQYNNFMDTGFAVSPRIVYSYDFEGTTAAPYSNYLEDRQAINLGVDGTLNNNLRVGVSYSNFFGGHINNKSSDRDFAAVSASYSF